MDHRALIELGRALGRIEGLQTEIADSIRRLAAETSKPTAPHHRSLVGLLDHLGTEARGLAHVAGVAKASLESATEEAAPDGGGS